MRCRGDLTGFVINRELRTCAGLSLDDDNLGRAVPIEILHTGGQIFKNPAFWEFHDGTGTRLQGHLKRAPLHRVAQNTMGIAGCRVSVARRFYGIGKTDPHPKTCEAGRKS